MLTVAVLSFNRPKETELCVSSIRRFFKVEHEIVLLDNGSTNPDFNYSLYKAGLIDKLILRKENGGTGLGTRELFNDFNLNTDYLCYVQCDQFAIRDFTTEEFSQYKEQLDNKKYSHIDLAGNQGHGRFSERACLWKKSFYNSIPNGIAGPGPYSSSGKWTEQYVQEYLESNKIEFYSAQLLFADNGKVSVRRYRCGGLIEVFTDTKQLFVVVPPKVKDNQPNLFLDDDEWDLVISGKWENGKVPRHYLDNSFKCWEKPLGVEDFK